MDKKKLTELTEAFKALKDIRYTHEQDWKQVVQWVTPRGGTFDPDTEPRFRNRDQRQHKLFDKTVYSYSIIFARGLKGYVCSSGSHFFSLNPKFSRDRNDKVKAMLQAREDQMYDAMATSTFYKATETLFKSYGNFGTAIMLMGYDRETGDFIFKELPLGDCYLSRNRVTGEIDTLFHVEWLTRAEAIDLYGEDKLSDTIRNCKDYAKSFRFIQLYCPRTAFDLNKEEGIPDYRYIELAWEDGRDEVCYISGTDRKRFAAPVFSEDPDGGAYGVDYPGYVLTSTSQIIQRATTDQMNASQLMTNPPLKKTEGLTARIRPGGFIDIPAGQDINPMQIVQDVSWTNQMREDQRLLAKQVYYVDFFLMLSQYSGNVDTATLAQGLQNEQVKMMSSFLDCLLTDFFEPVIQYVYSTMEEEGLFTGDAEGDSEDVSVKMVSELYRLQEQLDLQPTQTFISGLLPLSQVDPQVTAYIDAAGYAEVLREKSNADIRVARNREQAQKILAAQAEAQAAAVKREQDAEQQKADASMISAMAGAAKDAGEAAGAEGQSGGQGRFSGLRLRGGR